MNGWQAAGFWCGIAFSVALLVWSIYRLGQDAGRRERKFRTVLTAATMDLGTRIQITEAWADDPKAYRLKALNWTPDGGLEVTVVDEKRRPNTW